MRIKTNLTEEEDYLEIDRYGIAAKLESGLAEFFFVRLMRDEGYNLTRMPEDMAKHLWGEKGRYNFDFTVKKRGDSRKVEVKSLWGTDTRRARLIHSKSKDYETSSCKFETQDIFAVNMWLRTGNIKDFAFAVSEYEENHANGLPCATKKTEISVIMCTRIQLLKLEMEDGLKILIPFGN
ncbi:hypothetical protein AKJ37_07440 [candidate division MSBL1 archaeon SCGC-AAA259I09]|uniref:Uncharacterized protein n=2 Tax=candidate division MSBL1 TaxID=215777 RepID=A0A133UKH6_9EURY|nr:hypothetical protein AKJ37_07440 [candidate division MSBL1 archaeon SCGC-AAA259I09]KXA96271.1 hypothetical protein AKJ39_04845 [candidate division MSBL1 archaeon SCGC-AAA259J03]